MPKKSDPRDLALETDPTPETPPAAEAAPAAEEKKPDPNELVSVFNHNPPGGDYVHHLYEEVRTEDGRIVARNRKTEFRAVAQGFSNVPRWIAELWKRLAPDAIVDGQTVAKGAKAPPASSERISALEAENADYKTRLANMEKMLAELKASSAR